MTENKTQGFQTPEKKDKGKGAVTTVVVIAALVGGASFAAYKGLIPGFGSAGKDLVGELKADIESLKGGAIEDKIAAFYKAQIQKEAAIKPELQAEYYSLIEDFQRENELSLSYEKLEEVDVFGRAAVKIVSPELAFNSLDLGEEGVTKMSYVEISRDVNDPNRYFYKESGDIDLYLKESGVEQKFLSVKYNTDGTELRLNDEGELEYSKGRATDMRIIEGRGNTVLLSIDEVKSEQSTKRADGKVDFSADAEYNGIRAGDFVRLMIGDIPPISIKMDVDYKGDDFNDIFTDIERRSQEVASNQDSAAVKALNGDLDLNNFSLMLGDAGIKLNGDLAFKDSVSHIPKGTAKLTLANYDQLLAIITRFFPLPPTEVEAGLNFLRDVGEESDGDIVFNLEIDGTENVKIGGRTMDEIELLQQKYAPSQPLQQSSNEQLQVEFIQESVAVPEVQTKELPAE